MSKKHLNPAPIKLSIVTTLYNSSLYIREFCTQISAVAQRLVSEDYEIILVNDGSPDDSLAVAIALAEKDGHITVVDLSRNFGHHRAMITGLGNAKGERIFLIDVDLEEKPEWLVPFTEYMDTSGCDVVYGVQKTRKGGRFERISGGIFWRVFNKVACVSITPNVVTCRLMSRRYVDASLLYQEREVFAHAVWQDVGFDQRPYDIDKGSSSPTTYTLSRKLSLFVNAIASFSSRPLLWIFYFGFLVSFGSFFYISCLAVRKILFTIPIDGWTSLIASVWLFGGLISMFLGIIGMYVGKIFLEVKQRPYSVVRQIYNRKNIYK